MSQILEAMMVVSFGISWPSSLLKSYTSRTAKGKSIIFLLFILLGYLFGIASKFIAGNVTYVVIFYILNFIMVLIDLFLYFRNKKFDAARDTVEEVK